MADHRLNQTGILAYAQLSHDHNPLHVDEAVAKQSPFGGIVAHGFLLLTGALDALDAAESYPKRLHCAFKAPGRPGDTLATDIATDGSFEVSCGGKVLVAGTIASGASLCR